MADPTVEDMVKATIQAQIVAAFKKGPELIEELVKAALSGKVDDLGKPSSYGGKSYLDYLVYDSIRHAASAAVIEVMKENEATIVTAVRQRLTVGGIADAMAKALVDAAVEDWRINVKFERGSR